MSDNLEYNQVHIPTPNDSFDTLEVTKVNTYNMVLHWQGSDASLKPVLLTAHQGGYQSRSFSTSWADHTFIDVVPVEPVTVDAWIHPPYSGYYDGQHYTVSRCYIVLAHGEARNMDLGSRKQRR